MEEDGTSVSSNFRDLHAVESETDGEQSVSNNAGAKMYLGSFDELNNHHHHHRNLRPSRRASLESIESGQSSVCMYDEDEEKAKKAHRRSSFSEASTNSRVSRVSRRSSYNINANSVNNNSASVLNNNSALRVVDPVSDGYGTDDDDDIIMTPHSVRRRASMTRRGSATTPQQLPPSSISLDHNGAMERRGSNGMTRRGTNGGVAVIPIDGDNNAVECGQRRSSTGQFVDAQGVPTRRGSTGQRPRRAARRSSQNRSAPLRTNSAGGKIECPAILLVPQQSPQKSPRRGRREQSGFNETIVNRMNHQNRNDRDNVEDEEDEEEDESEADLLNMDYGYSNPYGYSASSLTVDANDPARRGSLISAVSSNGAVVGRRGSNYSQSSFGMSNRRGSRLRHSHNNCHTNMTTTEQMLYMRNQTPNGNNSESEDERNASQSTGMSTCYGYDDYESDAQRSNSSRGSGRSRRRNSYLHRPEQNPSYAALLLESTRVPDRDMNLPDAIEEDLTEDDEPDDLKDPDSLLSRSGYHKNRPPVRPYEAQDKTKEDITPTSPAQEETKEEDVGNRKDQDPEKETTKVEPCVATGQSSLLKSPKKKESTDKKEAASPYVKETENGWGHRTFPFTTSSQSPLTAKKLKEASMNQPAIATEMIPSNSMRTNNRMNWGELELDSSGDSSVDSAFMLRMYEDSPIVQEIDRYKQRARRRESIDRTVLSMDRLPPDADSATVHSKRIQRKEPNFIPGKGCTNASDFIVRCFTARLRQGIGITKHNRSRWSKSSVRELFLVDGRTLSWRRTDGEEDKGRRPKLDLTKCREVRHAFTKDPLTRRQTGTSTLRKRCKDGSAGKSFSLIFGKRTLDITAMTNDQCKVLMEGFSALCYRLQLEAANEGSESQNDSRHHRLTDSKSLVSDDWASTIYSEAVPTLSTTHTSIRSYGHVPPPTALSPWGL